MPVGIILWHLARCQQVDGTSRALSRTLVRTESIARLYISPLEYVVLVCL